MSTALMLVPRLAPPSLKWLPEKEFLEYHGICRRTLYNRKRDVACKTIDGKRMFATPVVTFDGMRAELAGQGLHSTELPAGAPALSAPLFGGGESARAVAGRSTLDDDPSFPAAQRARAEWRLAAIQPLLEYAGNAAERGRWAQLRLTDGTAVKNSNLLARYLVETHTAAGAKLSEATLWRWKREYLAGGLRGLARSQRSDKGQAKWFTRWPAAAQLVASCYLKPYQTAKSAYVNLQRAHETLGIAKAELPCYETVRLYLETIPKPIATLAREGERAYDGRHAQYTRRMFTDVAANQIWVADHMIHDVEVRNDCFAGLPLDAPMRLRFSAILDMRSRKLVGYCWAPEGNSRAIMTALRRACERYGPCVTFYCDNGADYKKVAKGAKTAGFLGEQGDGKHQAWMEGELAALQQTGALHALGIEAQFCLPYHPQSKLIERFFRTMHGRFDALFPHYTSGMSHTRPDQTTLGMMEHRKLVKAGRGGESEHVPASHFLAMATAWIEEHYNARHAHTGQGMNKRTPDAVFNAGYPEGSRRTANAEVLASLLWERETRTLQRGRVRLNNQDYVPANAVDSTALHLADGRKVTVAYDPCDPDRALVMDMHGRRIGEMRPERLLAHGASAQPAIAASMAERKRLKKTTVATVRQIHENVALLGHRSDVDLLSARALKARPELAEAVVQPVRKRAEAARPEPARVANTAKQMEARMRARTAAAQGGK